MSWVSSVMLSFSNEELWADGEDQPRETCEPLELINAWITDGRLVSLVGPTYEGNAGYGMDANLYGGGFNHFDIEGFIAAVRAQAWKNRAKVQLWVKDEEEEVFTLINLGRRRPARPKSTPTVRPKTKPRQKAKLKGGLT